MSATPRSRYERKYVVPHRMHHELAESVYRHPALFFEEFPPRTVNSIYFDSFDLASYRHHVAGLGCRIKVRIRWYDQPFGRIEAPVMEWKIKQGLLGEKLRYSMEPFSLDGEGCRISVGRLLDLADLPPFRAEELRTMTPVLLASYRRRYFRSADRRYRLTLDANLGYRSSRGPGGTWSGPTWPRDDSILELKYPRELDDGVAEIANRLPGRVSRFSKYVTGIEVCRLAA